MRYETKRTVVDVSYTCDACGAELSKPYRDIGITIRKGDDIVFEWWNKGDYCDECAELLWRAIESGIPVPERCTDSFRNSEKATAIEVAAIKKQRAEQEQS